jgi:hypothetical protein
MVTALSRLSPPWSARQQRQLAYLSEYTSDIWHTPGHANFAANALSRPRLPQRQTGPAAQHKTESKLSGSVQPQDANLSAAGLHASNRSEPLPPAAATTAPPPSAPITEPPVAA